MGDCVFGEIKFEQKMKESGNFWVDMPKSKNLNFSQQGYLLALMFLWLEILQFDLTIKLNGRDEIL
jgi:hypothetical protein